MRLIIWGLLGVVCASMFFGIVPFLLVVFFSVIVAFGLEIADIIKEE